MFLHCVFFAKKASLRYNLGGDCMNNFTALKQYLIPTDLLTSMLEIYKLIGKNEAYHEALADNALYLKEQIIERDTYFLALTLNLNITDNRMRLIITKNSHPTNNEEKILVGLKEVLRTIHRDAKKLTFNGSEILQFLNKIFGKNSHKFTSRNFSDSRGSRSTNTKPVSIRLTFEKLLEEYYQNMQRDTYEHLHLSMVTYLEMDVLKPYSEHNDLASILMLYYMLLRSDLDVFAYVSFMEKYHEVEEAFKIEKRISVVNYPDNFLQLSGIMRILFKIIISSYANIKEIIKNNVYEERMYKGDGIEQTIYRLPNTFSKDDIRRFHPNVSESTINRTLFKLRDENIIKPLGKGRSARWVKLIDENHPRQLFGGSYEIEDSQQLS